MLLGHEAAGIVEQVGDGVTDVARGDRVVMTFLPRCGQCAGCRADGRLPCDVGSAANSAGTLVGGGMCTTATSDAYARATQAIMSFVYGDQVRGGGMLLFSTSNLAMCARAFREMGGFSSHFRRAAGEDYDLCARWYNQGGQSAYLPDALVVHDHALTFGRYLLQHFHYGRGLFIMRLRVKERGGAIRPGRMPGGFHLRLIVSPIRARRPFGLGCAFLIALSQVATAGGVAAQFLSSRYRKRNVVELAKAPSKYA